MSAGSTVGFGFHNVTLTEVLTAINNIKSNAMGIDLIPIMFITMSQQIQ